MMPRTSGFNTFSKFLSSLHLLVSCGCAIYIVFFAIIFFSEAKDQATTGENAKLIEALHSPDPAVRRDAADALGDIGGEAKEAIPALIAALKDQDVGVSLSAAGALKRIGEEAREAVPALIAALKGRDVDVRSYAATVLGSIGGKAKEAVPVLIAALKDQDVVVRSSAARALGNIGGEAKEAIPALIAALKDQDVDVRRSAADALGNIGGEAKEAVPALIAALKDQDVVVRQRAANALGDIGGQAKEAIPALIAALKDWDADVGHYAANALSKIGKEVKEAVPALIAALKDQDVHVRRYAAIVLGSIGGKAKEAVPALIAALKDQDVHVRRPAADALGKIGGEAKEAVPALIAALKDQDEYVRRYAADALGKIAVGVFDAKSIEALSDLNAAYKVLSKLPEWEKGDNDKLVKRTIDYFESLWWVQAREGAVKTINDHPYITVGAALYLLLQFIWLLLFWRRPLILLKAITSLSKTGEKFKIPKADISIPLKTVLIFPVFHYHPRLLDAWTQHHLAISIGNFNKKQSVAQRKVYVTMPALIDEKMSENLCAASFQSIFAEKKATVLIAGEGGAGKTSLACQMANWAMTDESEHRICKTHRMLPVLIEANLPAREDKKDVLVEAVRGQLQDLIGEPEPIFEELLLQLLRKRRVLVIVDSLSELDETTRKSVRPADADFPVAALIVTSRIDEYLGGVVKSALRPIRLKSDRLSTFMDRYLEQLGKRELFIDEEYFDACRRLSQLISDREITVLIAKMYAEQMIAANETDASNQTSERDLPRNLPDLMLGYLKRLNDQVKANGHDIGKVVDIAKAAAWECLKITCRPTAAKRNDVLKALSQTADAETLLVYLEKRLQLIQTVGPISESIRFSLDPLAEYLAALYLIERCGKNENRWQEFFENVETQSSAPETIKGFLLAIHDCCVEKGSAFNIPAWVENRLAEFAPVDSDTVKAARLKKRIKLLIANLDSHEAFDRITALQALGELGASAKAAIPDLVSALSDQKEEVRPFAAMALGKIGKDAVPALANALSDPKEGVRPFAAIALRKIGKDAVPALAKALEDESENVRCSAADTLGNIGAEAIDALPDLIKALEDESEDVRCSAAVALGNIGAEAKDTVRALAKALEDESEDVRWSAADTLGNIGVEAIDALPDLIKALEDESEDVRCSAADALGNIGAEAKDAVPVLVDALKSSDGNQFYKETIERALERIQS